MPIQTEWGMMVLFNAVLFGVHGAVFDTRLSLVLPYLYRSVVEMAINSVNQRVINSVSNGNKK